MCTKLFLLKVLRDERVNNIQTEQHCSVCGSLSLRMELLCVGSLKASCSKDKNVVFS